MAKQRKEELPEGVVRFRGKLFARITYYDENNKRKQRWKQAKDITEAKRVRRQLLNELEDHGARSVDKARVTFKDLAKHYEDAYLVEAEYRDGELFKGLRSIETPKLQLQVLRTFFATRLLRSIKYSDLMRFRAERLKTPTRGDLARYKQELLNENVDAQVVCTRAIASVNRELALLRRMFNVALQEEWLIKNPFKLGEPLISAAKERKRERILTREEEWRLLAACAPRTIVYTRNEQEVTAIDAGHKNRELLRSLIIMALDTGCRLGEMLKLQWRDVDFQSRLITLQAFNTKTMRERQVSVTGRLQQELEHLWAESKKQKDALVFGTSSAKRSFASVRKLAGLPDVRFHDLRHTHASRLDNEGFSLASIGGQLGHTQVQTTLRYLNRDRSAVMQVAAALDAFNNEAVTTVPELIN